MLLTGAPPRDPDAEQESISLQRDPRGEPGDPGEVESPRERTKPCDPVARLIIVSRGQAQEQEYGTGQVGDRGLEERGELVEVLLAGHVRRGGIARGVHRHPEVAGRLDQGEGRLFVGLAGVGQFLRLHRRERGAEGFDLGGGEAGPGQLVDRGFADHSERNPGGFVLEPRSIFGVEGRLGPRHRVVFGGDVVEVLVEAGDGLLLQRREASTALLHALLVCLGGEVEHGRAGRAGHPQEGDHAHRLLVADRSVVGQPHPDRESLVFQVGELGLAAAHLVGLLAATAEALEPGDEGDVLAVDDNLGVLQLGRAEPLRLLAELAGELQERLGVGRGQLGPEGERADRSGVDLVGVIRQGLEPGLVGLGGRGLAGDRLEIAFAIDTDKGPNFRMIAVNGVGAFGQRLAMSRGIRGILERSGFAGATRTFMMGDASTRAYERLAGRDGRKAILMISPPRADGPPIRFGKPYSAIAHLAEDVVPYIAIDAGLRGLGFSAPEIYAHDALNGLAVIEDLGADLVVDGGAIIVERYTEAVAALAHLHAQALPAALPGLDGGTYEIPPYDIEALTIEVELLPEWYAPHIAKVMPASGAKAGFVNIWRGLFEDVLAAAPTWSLRDYHSPNLLWLADRDGLARVGMIDFQDCVLGHPAYDVASLLQDARVTVPADVELRLLSTYLQRRRSGEPGFDIAGFARAYAILGAQRATKILGIFARLDKRDRKPQYLVHIPRIQTYLQKNLAHPALAELKLWFEQNVPSILATAS